MPWEPGVNITPLPGLHRTAYMTEAIDDAQSKGARVVNEGGGAFCQTLFYPAVVYPVQEGMKLYREEQFGPIVPVMPFDDLETALEYVITSDHGQQVSIFGSDPQQIGALVDPLVNQVCRVNLNCQCQRGPDVFPFAGRKDSAEGTLSVTDALRAFSIRSMVAAKTYAGGRKPGLGTIDRHQRSNHINSLLFIWRPRPLSLISVLAAVTERIRRRSLSTRADYLSRLEAARSNGPIRTALGCTNLAHGFAAAPSGDKIMLRESQRPNIAIVSAYNDMLSAHQPFERFPAIIKQAAREAGATAQFAGGVPAMCDGVTQGEPGMELSLFSRDVIALATAVALSHNMFDAALCLGICDKIVPGLLIGALAVQPPAGDLRARRADDQRACPTTRRRASASAMPRARSGATCCSNRRPSRTTAPAPAPSTAPPTATRC